MPAEERRGAGATMDDILSRLDALTTEVTQLRAQKQQRDELWDEFAPVLKAMMRTATEYLDTLDKRGYFTFGREFATMADRVVTGFEPDDVRKLGDAIVSILETVRAVTQPEVLKIADEAAQVMRDAGEVEPLGIVGMVRATRHDDVQRGMAVMMELMRHVGRAAQSFAKKQAASPVAKKRARLAELTGARQRPHVLGIERPQRPAGASAAKPTRASAPEPPKAPTTIDGVAFDEAGNLADPQAWTRELASTLAEAEGLSMSDAHWKVIEFARAEYGEKQVSPNIRRLTQGSGLSTKELYALFPRAPARTVARIAGIPKPAGCI